jgi:hypothetical protein
MGLDLTSFDAALKDHYTDERVQNMTFKENPLLALMSKYENFGGRSLPIPLIWGNPQGRSANFQRAQTRGGLTSSKVAGFELTRVKDYSIATIDNETLEASKGDANAFMEAATTEIDGAINSLTRSQAISMYKSGYGEIGQIVAGGSVAGATFQLSQRSDVSNFEVGQELETAASLTGASRSFGSSGNGLIVTGVNRSTGVLTFGYNVNDATNGIPAIAAGDYIFVRGDHSSSTLVKLAGLEAWVPASAPSSTAFFGVDRSVDTRLGGQRLDGTGAPIEEILLEGSAIVAGEGQALTHYFTNPTKYNELVTSLGSKVQYVDLKVNAEVGFQGVLIQGIKGAIRVVPDQNCPANRVFGLNLNLWKLYSLGKACRVIDTDGLQMLRQASADGVEVRYGYYANIGCRGPGANINIQV